MGYLLHPGLTIHVHVQNHIYAVCNKYLISVAHVSPPEIGTVAKPQSLALARHNIGMRCIVCGMLVQCMAFRRS